MDMFSLNTVHTLLVTVRHSFHADATHFLIPIMLV